MAGGVRFVEEAVPSSPIDTANPDAAGGSGVSVADTVDPQMEIANPFLWKEPSPSDVAEFQKKQRLERAARMAHQNKLKVYEKNKRAQQLAVMTRDRHIEKEDLSEYIQKKRDMFLVQYALDVKRDEIKKLDETAIAEETNLTKAEAQLEADAGRFYQFLKENDRMSAAAVKQAEEHSQRKVELIGEVKAVEADIEALKSTISKNDDRLQELGVYADFLYALSPAEWQASRQADGEAGECAENEDLTSAPLYFTAPEQLLKLFAELEAQNLSLITNGQETEEGLQDLDDRIAREKEMMRSAEEGLLKQIASVENTIRRDEDKGWLARERASYFASASSDKQAEESARLEERITAVYADCIGANEASIPAIQMLTDIENKLEELLGRIAKMPPDFVEEAEKAKEKVRRIRAREEKVEAQQRHQEEKARKAIERAKAPAKRQTGKKMMYRSAPPKRKVNKEDRKREATEAEQEQRYFFSD